jgi:Protein of unknown function (DUF2723)
VNAARAASSLARLGPLAAFALPAIVYVASASREPGSWDTAELQGVPYILGISHPTGFPLYVLLGYVWSHLIPAGSIAFRMNAMSGIAMAVTSAAAYATARHFRAGPAVALAAALWFAFVPNIWSHAARAEAQDLALMCSALSLLAMVAWLQRGAAFSMLAAFALCGLGMAAHPNALWVAPALFVGAAIGRPRPSRALLAGSTAAMIAGLLLYAYLPLRSAYVTAHGLDPTSVLAGTQGGIFWNYNDPRTPHGLGRELSGTESQTPAYFLASLNPGHLAAALWAFVRELRLQYGVLGTIAVIAGLIAAWRHDWRATLTLLIAAIAGLVFSVVYPNESDVERYRMLVPWIAVAFFGALTPQSRRPQSIAMRAALIAFLSIGAVTALVDGRRFFFHTTGEGGRWVIDAVRPFVAPGCVIVTHWLDATSLAYGAYADRSLPGRIIVSDDTLRVQRYRRWSNGRRVFLLLDPHGISAIPGTRDYARLDEYHELFEVQP